MKMPTPYGFPQYVIDRVMQKRGRLNVFDRFDPKRTALLVIDMQNFYVGEIESVVAIIPNINRLAAAVRARGGRVVWVGMSAGLNGKSDWPIYHDYFFTREKGANPSRSAVARRRRPQVSFRPRHPRRRRHRLQESVFALHSRVPPTSRKCCSRAASTA